MMRVWCTLLAATLLAACATEQTVYRQDTLLPVENDGTPRATVTLQTGPAADPLRRYPGYATEIICDTGGTNCRRVRVIRGNYYE